MNAWRRAGALVVAGAVVASCGGDDDDGAASEADCEPQTVTFTTHEDGSLIDPTLPGEDDALAAAVAESFCAPNWKIAYPGGDEETVSPRPCSRARKPAASATGSWRAWVLAGCASCPGSERDRGVSSGSAC